MSNLPFLLRSHPVGRIAGIRIELAFSLYAIMAFLVLSRLSYGVWVLMAVVLLPVFVLAHELGHSFMAMHYRVRVRRVVLHALGGVAQLEGNIPGPVPEIWISLAGPAVSLFFAIVMGALSYAIEGVDGLYGALFMYRGALSGPGILCILLMQINILGVLFNLLPIFPMDGGRVAAALAVILLGPERGLRAIQPVAYAGCGILMTVGVVFLVQGSSSGLILILIGVMLLLQGRQELQAKRYAAQYGAADAWEVAAAAAPEKEPWENMDWHPDRGFMPHESQKEKMGFFARRRMEAEIKKREKARQQQAALRTQVDVLLEKVNREGIQSLTPKERKLLNDASQAFKREQKPL